MDGNPRLRVLRTETTNDPGMIAKQRKMTSINTALQVDLFAQANASRRPDRPGRVYSGFGGQTDFTVGALHSTGGRSDRLPLRQVTVRGCRGATEQGKSVDVQRGGAGVSTAADLHRAMRGHCGRPGGPAPGCAGCSRRG